MEEGQRLVIGDGGHCGNVMLTGSVEEHLTPFFVALGACRLGRIRPHTHDHLADAVAAQQRQEGLRRPFDATAAPVLPLLAPPCRRCPDPSST
jgi:hypothetical protein